MKHTIPGFLMAASLAAAGPVQAQVSTLARPYEPVVLTGAQLPAFTGTAPGLIIGFKYTGSGGWQQVPVQVDERVLLDVVRPYGPAGTGTLYDTSASNPKVLFYADTKTAIGADPNAAFDLNDELVFMAKDAGGQVPNGTAGPSGIVAASLREVRITDPLGGAGSVYLAKSAGSLQPGAGVAYVGVTTNLLTTPGFPVNDTLNPENTLIQTARYRWHQAAEWIADGLRIRVGSDVNILDRHKNFFVDGFCGRSDSTFSAAESAFETAVLGPVRAIRAVMGANSGVTTERRQFFYGGRIDIQSILRVHHIPGIVDAFDYTPAANGMTYRNNLNPAGVLINGVPDAVTLGDIAWEQVGGTQGTLSILHSRTTTIAGSEAVFSSYYDDSQSSPASNCTGDGQAWGTSGVRVVFPPGEGVCTDPVATVRCEPDSLRGLRFQRTLYFDSSSASDSTAALYNRQRNNPLQLSGSAVVAAKDAALDVPDAAALPALVVFPNPTPDGTVTVRAAAPAAVRAYNALGQLVLAQTVEAGDSRLALPAKGLVLLVVTQGGVQTVQRVVVQ